MQKFSIKIFKRKEGCMDSLLKKIGMVVLCSVGIAFGGYYFLVKNRDQSQKLDQEFVEAIYELQDVLDEDIAASNESGNLNNDLADNNELDHFPIYPEREISRTREEILETFKDLGITYCNKTLITYEPLLKCNARDSEKYKNNAEFYDQLSLLYADDVAAQVLAPISLRWLGGAVGHGVFAEDRILEGDFIGIYGGAVQPKDSVTNKDYAWAYPTETINDEPIDGIFLSLDARYVGNEMRFVNDGINPNCIVRYVIGHDNLWHVCYTALREIPCGEQLLVSYGKAYWETRKYKYQALADGQ
jgi:hypothetical protein